MASFNNINEDEFVPKPEFLSMLMSMGIKYKQALKALRAVDNYSVDAAATYIFENEKDSDSSDEGDGPELDVKMVFVINTSLAMNTGKVAAQVAHAAVVLSIEAQEKQSSVFEAWYNYGSTKIVLQGQDESELENLEKQAKQNGLIACCIRDAGRTEVKAGSMTVCGIFGEVDKVNVVTGKLKLLKNCTKCLS